MFCLPILFSYVELALSLSKNRDVNETAGNATACIAFSTEYATDFFISARSEIAANLSGPLGVGKNFGLDFCLCVKHRIVVWVLSTL